MFMSFWFVSEKQVMHCHAKRDNKWKSLDTANGYARMDVLANTRD